MPLFLASLAVFRNPHPPSFPPSLLPSSDAGQAPPALHDEFFLLLLTALLSEQGGEEGGEEEGEEKKEVSRGKGEGEREGGKDVYACCFHL